jgi:hypothetical protein
VSLISEDAIGNFTLCVHSILGAHPEFFFVGGEGATLRLYVIYVGF